MKNLANCAPREFWRQTNKIRKYVSKWLTDTEIMEIRRRLPEIPDDATDEDRKAAVKAQISRNLDAIFDAVMETHADETTNLLGMLCFVEPEDVDNHPMREYLGALSEMLNSNEVFDFFISLVRVAKKLGLTG